MADYDESRLTVVDHPLVQHKLHILRDKTTTTKQFRELVNELAILESYEAMRDFPLEDVEVETPLETMTAKRIAGKKVAIIPILRAGLGMVDGILELVPSARVGHVGMYRDPETHLPHQYYCKFPADIENRTCLVVDPMLATGELPSSPPNTQRLLRLLYPTWWPDPPEKCVRNPRTSRNDSPPLRPRSLKLYSGILARCNGNALVHGKD